MNTTIEVERVRRNTAVAVNQRIDETIAETVHSYMGCTADEIADRLDELDQEWDIERLLETNASAIALTGIGLSLAVDRRWLVLTTGVLGFLLLHGTQGWCPPLPMLRRLGVRTRGEIARERFALKYLRGDFDDVRDTRGFVNVTKLLAAMEY